MYSVDLMVEEHKNIKKMLSIIRSACYQILNGHDISYSDFSDMISFIKNYADTHHHGKEEKIFFNKMVKNLGPAAEKLVTHGMLVEHDLGRLHVKELEVALARVQAGEVESKLDVIANAIGYTHLLLRHIDKEDGVVYPFAMRSFNSETLDLIDTEFKTFEGNNTESEIYLKMLTRLEQKYLVVD